MDSNKFSNSIIYKIVCKDISITECYVGSTCNLKRRKWEHKSHCNNENANNYNTKVYKFIRDNGGFTNFEIIEIKKYNCNTQNELELEERKQMELYGGELNSNIPTRTIKEWRIENKEKLAENKKKYYVDNKEKLTEKFKKYYVDNREKLKEQMKEYRENNKEKIKEKKKEHYNNNKESIAEKKKEHYEKNKESIAEKKKEKYICGCGKTATFSHKARHNKTKKHLKYLSTISSFY